MVPSRGSGLQTRVRPPPPPPSRLFFHRHCHAGWMVWFEQYICCWIGAGGHMVRTCCSRVLLGWASDLAFEGARQTFTQDATYVTLHHMSQKQAV
jgi:hypothetical protein